VIKGHLDNFAVHDGEKIAEWRNAALLHQEPATRSTLPIKT
jgi:hypothetical protein